MIEGTDYELIIPDNDKDYWGCRILSGHFNETVIRFGAVALNEVQGALTFNFYVVSTPDVNATIDNEDLQLVAHDILQSVFDTAVDEGYAELTDRNTGERIEY